MTLQVIQSEVVQFLTSAYDTTVIVASWAGRQIQLGITDYLIPGIKILWEAAVPCFIQTKDAILAGHCPPLLIAGVLFVIGIAAFKIVDRKANEDNVSSMKTWTTIGTLSLIAATAFTSFAIASFIPATT